ncbi:MAG: hypothetical protein WBI34_02625, partial [Tenuifilaceae bacterium]
WLWDTFFSVRNVYMWLCHDAKYFGISDLCLPVGRGNVQNIKSGLRTLPVEHNGILHAEMTGLSLPNNSACYMAV